MGLPEGWVEAKLKELCSDISYGYTASSTTENIGPKLLRITDIQGNKVDWASVPFCEISAEKIDKYLLVEGDLVFARTGATVGKSFLIGTELPKAVYASYLIRVRLTPNSNIKFLAFFFRSPSYWSQITDFSAGVGQPNVNGTKLKELVLPVPPLNEQIRIVNKLDSLLAKVEIAQNRLGKISVVLKRFRQSVLAAATSGELTREWRGGIDHKWPLDELKNTGKEFKYGSSTKSQKTGTVPVLRMGNLQGGKLDWNDLVYSSDEIEIEKYALEAGDILFNRTNSPELVGKTSIYRGEQKAIYAGYLIKVCGSDRLDTEYLNIQLNSPHARHYCWQVKTDGVSQSNINAKKLQAYEFHLPPIEEQAEIVRRVESLFAQADKVEAQYKAAKTRLDKLTQSILAKAFRGELVPQDPNDEPASELLKRIQAEREQQPKTKPKRTRKVA